MRWAKPLDTELLLQLAAQHDALVTVEEGAIMGGAGSAVAEALHAAGVVKPVLQLGLRDEFIAARRSGASCWRCRGWMRPASRRRSARASAAWWSGRRPA